jgi:hypothetical protein
MEPKKVNIFVLGTEYHFLISMSIIEEHFSDGNYFNKFIFLGQRLSQIDTSALPTNSAFTTLFAETEPDIKKKVNDFIFSDKIENLFVVNAYRIPETYILSKIDRKKTKTHLMQDGALFYNRIEKSVYKNRIKEMSRIYLGLWKRKIFFTDIILYGRFMETSGYIDELWMTNPDIYIGPKTRKKINRIKLFPKDDSIQKFTRAFKLDHKLTDGLSDYLIYLSVIVRDLTKVPKEIEQIKLLQDRAGKSKVLIKLHPNSSDYQFEKMKEAFGEQVFRNYVPAEIYIANARNSTVVGCASTSLLYNNESCEYYALKKMYQEMGIYLKWLNIQLPEHVTFIESIDQIQANPDYVISR